MHIANCDIYITDCNICQGVKRRSIRGLISSTERFPQNISVFIKKPTRHHQSLAEKRSRTGPRHAWKKPRRRIEIFWWRNLSDEGQHERFTLSLWQQTN